MDNNINKIKAEVAKRSNISRRYLEYLLAGEKNARPKVASRLQDTTMIHKSIWVFGTADQRQNLFDNFVDTYGQSWLKG